MFGMFGVLEMLNWRFGHEPTPRSGNGKLYREAGLRAMKGRRAANTPARRQGALFALRNARRLMDRGSREIYKLTVRGLRMHEVPPNKGLGKIMQDTRLEDAGIADRLSQSVLHRRTMVDCQIRTFDVTDQPLLARMLEVPREHFLPGELAPLAYSDIGLQLKPAGPGGERRTLLPPFVL